jgi:pyruvyl transferase EpsI
MPRACSAVAANMKLRDVTKVVYALTPPPRLRNIGDHAQAVAITRWLEKHFPGRPIVEVDKDLADVPLQPLRHVVRDDDLIFLHSGGNLGDRGMWSERGRRAIIEAFPRNRIISLPQTIFFSDTEKGRAEKEHTRTIYGRHEALTVLGRDRESAALAGSLFPRATTFAVPDFVLSLPDHVSVSAADGRILLCLRRDDEGVLSPADRAYLETSLCAPVTPFDTTLDERGIELADRTKVVDSTLDLFARHAAVVTDRYHGVIFAVLTRRPCVVLPTVDHKLTSAIEWFTGISNVRMASEPKDVPRLLELVMEDESPTYPDWNATYFDSLPTRLGVVGRP